MSDSREIKLLVFIVDGNNKVGRANKQRAGWRHQWLMQTYTVSQKTTPMLHIITSIHINRF